MSDEQPTGNVTIRLVPYDDSWPFLFEREAKRIRGALSDQVLLLEHVGSTSIPQLAAKPVIDILLVVANSADETSYVPALTRAGYTLKFREPSWYEHRFFKGSETELNLHVFSEGCVEIERMLRFRDHLRASTDDRRAYEEVKRNLAKRVWETTQQYADAKSTIVEEILLRAVSGK
jgi:GrpB-like predicted nucleotidyltransferase (UPF0157 family)